MMIKEMRSEDKPRERFAKAPDTASMVDLVAILLPTGRHGCSVMDMAQEVKGRKSKLVVHGCQWI